MGSVGKPLANGAACQKVIEQRGQLQRSLARQFREPVDHTKRRSPGPPHPTRRPLGADVQPPISPVLVDTPATGAGTLTISSVPSEVDVGEAVDGNDTESDVSDVWEDASRAPSPDEFVMVYDSVSEASSED